MPKSVRVLSVLVVCLVMATVVGVVSAKAYVINGCLFSRGSVCRYFVFNGIGMTGIHMSSMDFTGSSFIGSNLSGAQARNSIFASTYFETTSMNMIDFSGADFTGARICNCFMFETKLPTDFLAKASLYKTTLPDGTVYTTPGFTCQ